MPTLRGWTESPWAHGEAFREVKEFPGITEAREVKGPLGNNTKSSERSRRQGLRKVGKGEGLLWERKHYALGGNPWDATWYSAYEKEQYGDS